MAVRTTAATDCEILMADGTTWVGFMFEKPRDQAGNVVEGAPIPTQEALAASDNDLPVSKRLQAVEQDDWTGGIGVDCHEAEGVYIRTGGYACPAGAATVPTWPAPASGTDDSPIVAIRQFQTDLFVAQTGNGDANTGRVLRSTDGGTTWANSLSLGAGEYARDLVPFDNGAGTQYLYVSVSNAKDPDPGTQGWFYRWNGSAWSARSAGSSPYSRQRMTPVHWVTQDGVGDGRLFVISGSKTVSYTKPGVDPFNNTTTEWVEGVRVKTAVNLLRVPSSRQHVYVTAQDNTFDLDEQGNSPGLTSYQDTLLHGSNGLSAIYLNDYLYVSLGQGLDRIYVGNGTMLQEEIGQCGVGWGTRARTKWTHSWTTELHQDQGMVVNAVHNPSTLESGIFWGRPRAGNNSSRNPMEWYGPEVIITGGYKVTAMRSMSPANDDLRFFVAGWKSGAAPVLAWVSLPISGAPIDDLVSGGKHRFATGTGVTFGSGLIQPRCRLHLIDEGFGSRTALKIAHQHALGTEGLSATVTLTLEERADPAPSSTSWTTSTTTSAATGEGGSAGAALHTITPATVVSGHRMERRVSFASNSTSTPAVLNSLRMTAWRTVPSVGVKVLSLEYGDGVLNLENTEDRELEPDWKTSQLETLIAAGGRTTMRLRDDKRYTVRFEQVLNRDVQHSGGHWGKRVVTQVECNVIAGPL